MPHPDTRSTQDPRLTTILRQLLTSGQSEAVLVAEFLADLAHDDNTDLDLLRASAEEIRESAQAVLNALLPTPS